MIERDGSRLVPELPRVPSHYWIAIPPFEREPDIEHVEDFGDGLVVRDDESGAWLPLADVWSEIGAYFWWGPLFPPYPPGDSSSE